VSQISLPVRIAALLGMLAAAGMMAWMFTAGAASTAESVDTPALHTGTLKTAGTPLAAAEVARGVAAKATAQARSTAAAGDTGTVKPAAAKATAPKVKASTKTAVHTKPKAKTAAAATPAQAKEKRATAAKKHAVKAAEGPATIASLLRTHAVVIVLLYDPKSRVDDYSVAEASLGATRAKAGFLRVNVLDQKQAAPFADAYGVLQDPTLLFFARPGTLVQKIAGFADHDTVAQAALNAATAVPAGK
jgi:hypothetical protein